MDTKGERREKKKESLKKKTSDNRKSVNLIMGCYGKEYWLVYDYNREMKNKPSCITAPASNPRVKPLQVKSSILQQT